MDLTGNNIYLVDEAGRKVVITQVDDKDKIYLVDEAGRKVVFNRNTGKEIVFTCNDENKRIEKTLVKKWY